MKKTDIEKNKNMKIDGKMKSVGVPGRFGQGAVDALGDQQAADLLRALAKTPEGRGAVHGVAVVIDRAALDQLRHCFLSPAGDFCPVAAVDSDRAFGAADQDTLQVGGRGGETLDVVLGDVLKPPLGHRAGRWCCQCP